MVLAIVTLGLAGYLIFPLPQVSRIKEPSGLKKNKSRVNLDAKLTTKNILVTLQFLRMCLGAGMTIPDSLTFICPQLPEAARRDIESVTAQFKLGKPLPIALDSLISRSPLWHPLVDSLIAASVSGSPIHAQLAELEQSLQTSFDMEKLNRIKSVAVRSVLPLGLCFLPAFILLAVVPLIAGLVTNFFNYPQ
jgi:pilus assembly protein TadC